MFQDIIFALIGGALIGVSATLMLRLNGKIVGISGILESSIFSPRAKDHTWKLLFILGLLAGGLLLRYLAPQLLLNNLEQDIWLIILGGFLVGFGTRLGSGCTSGHGVCGVSRFSGRSIVATLIFISSGFLAVAVFYRYLNFGGL